jgi:hypothetical protein
MGWNVLAVVLAGHMQRFQLVRSLKIIALVPRFCFYLYHFNCSWCLNSAFIWIYKTLFAFHKRSREIEVTLLRSWLHPTMWCLDDQCFYGSSFTPDDGASEHRSMGWKLTSFTKILL